MAKTCLLEAVIKECEKHKGCYETDEDGFYNDVWKVIVELQAENKKLKNPNCGLNCGRRGCDPDCPHHKP
ncbi:MAG: hypothetical protein ACUZ9M_00755 [Candidatus Scalindua sp.]